MEADGNIIQSKEIREGVEHQQWFGTRSITIFLGFPQVASFLLQP